MSRPNRRIAGASARFSAGLRQAADTWAFGRRSIERIEAVSISTLASQPGAVGLLGIFG
jgi:hypothetical protein